MTIEKSKNDFICNEYSVEIRNALAESADNFNPSIKSKKPLKKESKSPYRF
ncbi:MAG: hypothetical protein AAGU27_03780 [Dehalobacterium sp.]